MSPRVSLYDTDGNTHPDGNSTLHAVIYNEQRNLLLSLRRQSAIDHTFKFDAPTGTRRVRTDFLRAPILGHS